MIVKSIFAFLAFAAFAATANELAPFLDRGCAIAPDQANARVVVFDATRATTSAQPADVVWSWGARDEGSGIPSDIQGRFWQIDEAKLRDGGNTLLVSSSAAAWAEVDVATKRARRCGIAGDNTHSIEKLPDNTLVLAHSTNYNQLQLVWGEGTELTYKNAYPIYSAHGVEWDVKRNCLWALGYTNLVQLAYDSEKKTLTELKRWTFNPSGHDMRLCADGKIYFTNWYTVWQFDPDKDAQPKERFWETDVKGFHTDATYGDVYQVASTAGYYNDHVVVKPVSGSSFNVYPDKATKMYKVHWATAYPAAYTTYAELGEPSATVAEDGKSVRIAGEVIVPHATETTVEVEVNGQVVSNWVTSASGTFSVAAPVRRGESNTYRVTAVSTLAPESPVAKGGSFVARAHHGWYAVDFADPGYRPGTDWTDVTDVAAPGGRWTRQDANSTLDAVTRTLRLSDTTNLCYRPFKPSATGADTELAFRVKVYVSKDLPEMAAGSIAGFTFLLEGGKVVPHGYADGTWYALPGGDWQSAAEWADLKICFDFASANAPAVSYLLDGKLLTTADGVSALPFGNRRRRVTRMTLSGTGEFGDLSGEFFTCGPWPLGFSVQLR